MTRVIDTSVLYAAFDAADPRRPQALDVLAKPEPIDLPVPTLAEFLHLVGRRHGHAAAATAWEDLRSIGTIALVHPEGVEAALSLWSSDAGLSLVDALGIQCALKGPRLLTFDCHQAAVLRRLRPGG